MEHVNISDIQSLIMSGDIFWTEHMALRLRERNIRRADVIACVLNGEAIEQYPGDSPYPSCLILGVSKKGRVMHVVCSLDSGISCCMITAYYPNNDKWENDFRTRKVVE